MLELLVFLRPGQRCASKQAMRSSVNIDTSTENDPTSLR